MPALSPSASRSAWPSAIAVSSTVWCASTSRSPRGAHGQVEAAVLAELGEHVVEERHAGVDLGCARAVELELDQDLRLLGRALDLREPAHASTSALVSVVLSPSRSASRNAVVSASVPAVTRSQPGRPDVAHQHAAVQQTLPGRRLVAELAEQHEVRVRLDDLEPERRGSRARSRSRCSTTAATDGEQLVGARQRRARGGLGQHRQVVRQPHQLQRLDDRRVGGEVAEPGRRRTRTPWTSCGSRPAAAGRAAGRPPTGGCENSAYASSTTTSPGAAA